MKRKSGFILAMALIAGLIGCDKSRIEKNLETTKQPTEEKILDTEQDRIEQSEQIEQESEATTEQEETVEVNSVDNPVTITFASKNDDRYSEYGDVLLHVYYNRPVVEIHDNEEATAAIEQELANDEEMFFINCDSLEQEAILAFEDGVTEDMPGYANEVYYTEKRVDEKVVSFTRNSYSNTGGIHGNNFVSGVNFDVNTGEKLTIDNIAEDKDAFMEDVRTYVEGICQSDAYKDRLMPGYEENLDFVLQDDLWYFDYEGITFIANPYELAAYAEGVLYFTIPYTELTNLKPEYSYDGGFQKSANLGETISIDLDGDGTKDELTFNAEYLEHGEVLPTLTINGADYSQVLSDNQCYFAAPYEEYVVLDIDDSDSALEIALQDYGMSEDPVTMFFRYEGDKVTYLGYINDRISDLFIVNDGKGVIHARERMSIFETVNMKVSYKLENDKLTRVMGKLYPIAYSDGGREKGLLQDLVVYKEMSKESETVILDKETEIIALATDNAEWVQIQYTDGNIYYIHVVDAYIIDMNGKEVDSRNVFTDIIQAG